MVALFSKSDIHHEHFDLLFREHSRRGVHLMTTWPCVVEAAHLLDTKLQFELLGWVEAGGATAYNFDTEALGPMLAWMRRYSDRKRQMDVADASLYWLSVSSGVRAIFTTDLNDFRRYRLPDGGWFEILM